MNTIRADDWIELKLYSDGDPSSVFYTPWKNCLPINALIKMNNNMRRPRFAVSGTESTMVFMMALSEGHTCINLKILKRRKALNTLMLLLESCKNNSMIERITIIPSKRCR